MSQNFGQNPQNQTPNPQQGFTGPFPPANPVPQAGQPQDFNYQNQPNPSFNDYNQTPQNFDPNQQFAQQTGYDPNFANQPQAEFNQYDPNQAPQNFVDPAVGYNDPNQQFAQQPQDYAVPVDNNGFKVKKSGNKFLVIIVVLLIVVLGAASAALFYFNSQRQNTNSTQSSSSSSQSEDLNSSSSQDASSSQSSSSQESLSDSQTPAQVARIRNATSIPGTWLSQKFTNNGVDASGNCTNANICGDSADPDKDGLTNLDEYNYDTDPQNDDTDADGVSDGDEVFSYLSSPRLKDSDRDGVADFQELVACTDPIKTETTKMNATRLEQISQNVQLKSLKDVTSKSFTSSQGTQADITKGYFQATCAAQTSSSSANSATASSTADGGANVVL
jgi:cytoskeletal protein RodZ